MNRHDNYELPEHVVVVLFGNKRNGTEYNLMNGNEMFLEMMTMIKLITTLFTLCCNVVGVTFLFD